MECSGHKFVVTIACQWRVLLQFGYKFMNRKEAVKGRNSSCLKILCASACLSAVPSSCPHHCSHNLQANPASLPNPKQSQHRQKLSWLSAVGSKARKLLKPYRSRCLTKNVLPPREAFQVMTYFGPFLKQVMFSFKRPGQLATLTMHAATMPRSICAALEQVTLWFWLTGVA